MLICIFFFKQKTAYEMRISDWSSDVCSSDLLAPTRGDELKWTENDYGNIVTAFQFAYALGFLLMGWLIDRFGPKIGYAIAISIWKIGRASCRERVCQYV